MSLEAPHRFLLFASSVESAVVVGVVDVVVVVDFVATAYSWRQSPLSAPSSL